MRGRSMYICITTWHGPIRYVEPPDAISNQQLVLPHSSRPLSASGLLSVTSGGDVAKVDSPYQHRMTLTTKKARPIPIGEADLKRFVVQSALLSLIDPVRGEPTRTPLDENPDGDTSVGQKLKQKFLDAFALISSTSRLGAETASAVCLEQHTPDGAILRLARNCGLTPKDLSGLESVLQTLRLVAKKGMCFL